MCGIVGYIGKRRAYPLLVRGLHRLEYRGYDSAGVALMTDSAILNVYKSKGKVSDLERVAAAKDIEGRVGIAHTRWATHGEPNTRNAHPHCSQSGRLAMVHNGIIENYQELRQTLLANGYQFVSDTDSEVLVQYVEYMCNAHSINSAEALRLALSQVRGTYAVAMVDRLQPDTLVAARKGSPLVVGKGKDEFFIASDVTPLADETEQVLYLRDDEMVVLSYGAQPRLCTIQGQKVEAVFQMLHVKVDELEKCGYPHYMLKEIMEQPDSLQSTIRSFRYCPLLDQARRIIIVACGTSWHAGLIAKYAFEQMAHLPVEVDYAGEFRYRQPVFMPGDVLVAISQSGETADTMAAIQLAKQSGAAVLSICNVVGSSIPRLSDEVCYTQVGPEIGVASTKAFTAQVLVLMLLALHCGQRRGIIDESAYSHLLSEVEALPQYVRSVLSQSEHIRAIASSLVESTDMLYIGREYGYPVALEGALKLKEISYIHAEGYPAAEMKHGPIALISDQMNVVVVAPQGPLYEKMVSNLMEIRARRGHIISIVTEGDTQVVAMSDNFISIPATEPCLTPVLAVVPLQLLSYYVAVAKGCDVDQPRNLAKSVTVE